MPRLKSDFKSLTEKRILDKNPQRAHLSGSRKNFHNLVEKAKELGIVVDNLPNGSKRGSLLYDRKDQVVGREIFRFKIS